MAGTELARCQGWVQGRGLPCTPCRHTRGCSCAAGERAPHLSPRPAAAAAQTAPPRPDQSFGGWRPARSRSCAPTPECPAARSACAATRRPARPKQGRTPAQRSMAWPALEGASLGVPRGLPACTLLDAGRRMCQTCEGRNRPRQQAALSRGQAPLTPAEAVLSRGQAPPTPAGRAEQHSPPIALGPHRPPAAAGRSPACRWQNLRPPGGMGRGIGGEIAARHEGPQHWSASHPVHASGLGCRPGCAASGQQHTPVRTWKTICKPLATNPMQGRNMVHPPPLASPAASHLPLQHDTGEAQATQPLLPLF